MAPTSEKTRDNGAKSKAQDATKTNDSSTGVNYSQNVFSGVRKTKGFKCDTGLYAAFKPVAQHYFGSICHPLECFMVAVLTLQKEQVNFGTTVTIQNLNINRDLRTRRKLVAEKCGFKGCKEPATTIGLWKNKELLCLCGKHLQEAEVDPKNWKVLKC